MNFDKNHFRALIILLLCPWFCLLSNAALARLPVYFLPAGGFGDVSPDAGKYTLILVDSTKKKSFREIIAPDFKSKFANFKAPNFSGNFAPEVVVWRKALLQSNTSMIVFVDFGFAEYIDLYIVYANDSVVHKHGGANVPSSLLSAPDEVTNFGVLLPSGKVVAVYARMENEYPFPMIFSFTIDEAKNYWKIKYFEPDRFLTFFLGALLIMIFYNALLFITAREKAYLLYVFYMVVMFLINFLDSRFYLKLIPALGEYPEEVYYISNACGQAISVIYLTFSRNFIPLAECAPRFNAVFKWWSISRLASIPIIILLAFGSPRLNLIYPAIVLDIMMAILNLVVVYRTRQKVALYFVMGGAVLIIGASLTVLELFNVLLFGEHTHSIPLQIGILCELVIFSIGLGVKVKKSEADRRLAERQLLNQLLENEKLQTQVNRELEDKVHERTTEIERRNKEIMKQNVLLVGQKEELQVQAEAINKANEIVNEKNEALKVSLEKLKIAQAELVQSEKMASLGQLTAGIAHEINNPINFVSANVRPIKNDFAEIENLFNMYRRLHTLQDCRAELLKTENYAKKIDADYLFEEITLLLNGIEEGAYRTQEIVLGLRNFSRLEENNFKPANIHGGLDSTLMLIMGKIKNRVSIVRDYDEAMPSIECFPGKINQVFMNVLTNALQAIPGKGEIIITTRVYQDVIKISIKDNGEGMSPEVKEKIFEPFFTTKEIGKGTGLGLSISYGIIEDHHGKIEVQSEEGNGAEFIITLPLRQPVA